MSKSSKDLQSADKPAEKQGALEKELKRVIQYISQVYQVQKKMGDQLTKLETRIGNFETAIGKLTEASGKAVEDSVTAMQEKIVEAVEKQITSSIKKELLPKIQIAPPTPAPPPATAPAPPPTPAPAPAPSTTPAVAPAPPPPTSPRRPSDVPDARVATVVEALENIIQDLKGRQKVQREYLKPMLENARDVAMNNLTSRATAASAFKELIALAKSSPFDVPPDIVAKVISRLEELTYHIQS